MSVEAIEYLEDPDAILWAYDAQLGEYVEIGYGYKDKKRGTLFDLNRDPYSRQLLQETDSLRETKFRRQKHPGNRCPEAKPIKSYRPTNTPTR